MSEISKLGTSFYIDPITAIASGAGIILSLLSYFVVPEKYRIPTVYAAYIVLLVAVGLLTTTTGGSSSPFVATWMIATIFAGIFGTRTIITLFIGLNLYLVYAILQGDINEQRLLGVILAGELPILVSYILWHGKSSNEITKDRAYYDLANELDQVANKSEVVINAINDGVLAVNNEGLIELINPAAQRIIGLGNQDALNIDYKTVMQLLSSNGKEIDAGSDPIFGVLTTNQPAHRSDLQLQTNSGKKIIIDIVVSPIGHLGSGAIVVFRDVTKEQAEGRAQAEFISTASHEMRTPVASIEGYLGLALNPATATIDDKARDFITKAHESAQHLGRLFQDLLDVSKAEDGRLSNNPKVIEIVEFTNTIIGGLRQKAEEKNLRIFFKPTMSDQNDESHNAAPIYYVDLDSDHLREVLANLIENAIKYTPKGEVVIDIKADDEHVVVSISDSGIGIPTEDIPHLFQKFYRVDNSDTREIGGTGLGLYLCRRLVEAMSGRIWVDSEYKKGSTFSVELPRISHQEANRLIEASSSDSIKPAQTQKYLNTEGGEGTPSEERRAQALATPIILNHSAPVNVAAPRPAEASAGSDPLVGGGESASEEGTTIRPHNDMVIPPSVQSMPSTLQTAPPQSSQPQQ